MRTNILKYAAVLSSAFILSILPSCNNSGNKGQGTKVESARAGINEVIIHMPGDADKLNPLSSTSADAGYIQNDLFFALLSVDPDSFTLIPALAVSRPKITQVEEGEYKGGLTIEYELRPEAKWDNGQPITAEDIEFTLKAIKNPKVDCEQIRPYYEFIDDIKIDPSNNRKFTFYCKGRYFVSEIWSGITPLPEYAYDPDKIMRKFKVKDLNNPKNAASYKGNADIIKFAEQFNAEYHSREVGGVVGSGPYKLDQWITGQRIILGRKKDWWGDKLKGVNRAFIAKPEKLIYEVVVDPSAALAAIKGEKLDVSAYLKSKDFIELVKDEKLKEKYNLAKPEQLAYTYVGINMRNPKLEDQKVRRALAHLMDVDKVIEKLAYGLGKRVTGPINPRKAYYNHNLQFIPFDIAKANSLLDEAGWKDSDGDGIRDKVIKGQKTKLSLNYKLPSGNDVAEKVALLFQENCKKAGIEITITQKEWTVFLEENKAHNFELYTGAWISAPVPDDPKQIWSTSSYNGGSNYVGFGDKASDDVIEKLRYEMDETKRNEYYKQFQQMVYDAQPYIFMYSPLNKEAIHRRFKNAEAKVARPGYVETEFELDPDFGVKPAQQTQAQ